MKLYDHLAEKVYGHSFHEYKDKCNLQKILRIVHFQIKDRIFAANYRTHVYLSKVVYFSSSFTLPPNHLFTSDRRTDRNQDGGRTGKPGLIIIWTIDLGNRSFKVSKWPILG